MDLQEIKDALENSDPQQRMRGIRELRNYEADVAAPLLLNKVKDSEFLVRSFVAMGLGKKRSAEAFAALLEMMKSDSDPNVRSEAANSLSYYGDSAVSHLRQMYEVDSHWLIRRSIIAALADLNALQELLEICVIGLSGDDEAVMESCIGCLGLFPDTEQQEPALRLLLSFVEDESWRIRIQVAKSLGKYDAEQATAALNKLKTDENHQVVGAVLESLM
ncbi:HEAT repeat domain-containing protein [Waterburya agarophytonicola K14]|uniref:HEAT repeat domain-containing protein n=1 Tax=Waterburya agarophytonicola KI4 TaxID=2874699 RepID=A0A964BVH0_9CYAN|nr:HEAT repeat domain-containing protein [Waterburya agarophytonicola]MCC0179347.1 HEAT repeat domain-containing protein [Waterburya agarophytonicola KI4]